MILELRDLCPSKGSHHHLAIFIYLIKKFTFFYLFVCMYICICICKISNLLTSEIPLSLEPQMLLVDGGASIMSVYLTGKSLNFFLKDLYSNKKPFVVRNVLI